MADELSTLRESRSHWLHAHSLWRKRSQLHDGDVRARASASAVHHRVRGWLRVVERVRFPRGHLALRCRRAALGSDRVPPLLHPRGRSTTHRRASARGRLSVPPAGRAGGPGDSSPTSNRQIAALRMPQGFCPLPLLLVPGSLSGYLLSEPDKSSGRVDKAVVRVVVRLIRDSASARSASAG